MEPVTRHTAGRIEFATRGPGFTEVTRALDEWLAGQGANDGLLNVFVMHTSASLTIQENADPDVQRDLLDALDRVAPRDHPYRHSSEGPDDMPSHIRSMLTSTTLSIPVVHGRMVLGVWQGVYLVEHRDAPHERRIMLTFIGTDR
ncbi:MAG: secondary thiamine-phosphate synthase enzyme YjbQ [Hyphomicrobiaceae bacterium]|nr:secondary thiamine-phosphate synthase enzyme YjbQ [Hyphomicrobiaceae bacterium]